MSKRNEVTSLADLRPDPRNARRHTPRNVGMLESALREVGAARSIVIDESGCVLAGNATIEAAAAAGIERVQVVDADGETIVAVRRTGLTPEQKTRLALYDNRTAELAEWDEAVVAALSEDGLLDGLWSDDELSRMLNAIDSEPTADTSAKLGEGLTYSVIVECDGETQQGELLTRLEAEGLKCRALIS